MTFKLEDFLPYRASVAAEMLSRRFAALYEKEAGLTIAEWRILAHLSDQAPASVRDITKRVNLEKSIVSRAAARLEERGLIARAAHQGDQRLIALDLTAAGQDLMGKLSQIALSFQAELMRDLGEEGQTALRLLKHLGQ